MTDRDRAVRETLIELVLAFKKRGYNMVNDAIDDIADEIRALDLPLTSARDVTDHLRRAFRAVDNKDWEYLFTNLLDGSGHGQFWCAVLSEARTALASAPQPSNPEPRKDGDVHNSERNASGPDIAQAQSFEAGPRSDASSGRGETVNAEGLNPVQMQVRILSPGPAFDAAPQPACVGEDEMAGRKAKMLALHRAVCAVRSRRMPAFEHDGTALLDDLGLACLWGAQAIDALSPAPSPQAGGEMPEIRRQAWRAAICTHAELAGRGDAKACAFWKNELAMFDQLFPNPNISARREGQMANWQTPAEDLTNAELVEQWNKTAAAFDEARDGDGHGGSPGEWAYERCMELEGQFKKRGMPAPTPAQQEASTKARSSTAEPAAHNGLVAGSTPAAPTTNEDRKPCQR